MVMIPARLLASWVLSAPACSRTAAYRVSMRRWNLIDPYTMNGMGRNASQATPGTRTRKVIPMRIVAVAVCSMVLAPLSRNRSSWLTSSLSTAISSPVDCCSW